MSDSAHGIDDQGVAAVMSRGTDNAVAASIAAAILHSAFVFNTYFSASLLLWLLAVVAIGVFRLIENRRFRHRPLDSASIAAADWISRFDRGTFLNGLAWGIGGALLGQTHNFVAYVVYALCLCGLFAGAIASYFVHVRAVFLYSVPAVLPFSLIMLTHEATESVVVGGCMLTFFGIASIAAVQLSDTLKLAASDRFIESKPIDSARAEIFNRPRGAHMYRSAVLTSIGSLLAAALVIFLLRGEIDLNTAALWFVALVAATAFRIKKVAGLAFGNANFKNYDWILNFNLPLSAVGLVWSVGAISLPQSLLGEMLMMLCLFGLVAGFSGHLSAVISLAIPTVMPFSVFLLSRGGELDTVLGLALAAFSGLQVVAASRNEHIVREGLAHEAENRELILSLQSQANTIKDLNNDLEARVKLRTEELNLLVSELRDRTTEVAASRKQYRDIVEQTHELIFGVNDVGLITFANSAWQNTLRYGASDLNGALALSAIVAPESREHCLGLFSDSTVNDGAQPIELDLIAKNGQRVTLAGSIYSEPNSSTTFGLFRNVTEAKAADAALHSSEARFRAIFSHSSLALLIVDSDLKIIDANPCAQTILGLSSDRLCGNTIRTIVGPEDRSTLENLIRDLISSGSPSLSLEITCLRGGQEPFWAELEFSTIKDTDGAARLIAVVVHDGSQRKAIADALNHNASHDYLTGLMNRREFEHRLEKYLESAVPSSPHALAYFDLDRFKLINDSCGHSVGDSLLRALSNTLSAIVPPDCDLARIGGDEFALLIPATSRGEAEIVARTVIGAIEQFRFEHEHRIHSLGVSAGIVLIRGGESRSDVMQNADAACYAAKRSGRNRIEFYDSNRSEMRLQREQIRAVSQLANALNDNRIRLFAQPIAAIGEHALGPITRYELLLRIQNEFGELVGPGELLPAAEKYGYASEIDQWVVQNTLQAFAEHTASPDLAVKFSINLSAQSLLSSQFEDYLAQQLRVYPFSKNLCFEITENEFMSNFERATSFMQRMQRMGCQFALDDFGTGFSSYGYLKSLKLDFLKIDGTFIRAIDTDPVDKAIVKSIVEVARAINITTIAEYVEREEQAEILRGIGVDLLQGYAVGREVPIRDALSR